MIGGIVIETIMLPDKVWIRCEEPNSTSQCAIYVERNKNSEAIKRADSIWWQAGNAMWTPYANRGPACKHKHHYSCKKPGVDYDIRIRKIGFSGVSRPVPTQKQSKV